MSDDISVQELASWRASGHDFVLLDVREPYELQLAALPGSLNIPLRDLPARVGELDPSHEIAVLCHVGARSAHAAKYLRALGYKNARNVHGGIEAYAASVDPSIPRY